MLLNGFVSIVSLKYCSLARGLKSASQKKVAACSLETMAIQNQQCPFPPAPIYLKILPNIANMKKFILPHSFFFFNLCLSFLLADTRMHPVLKGLGVTEKAISFIMVGFNGNKVKSSCDQGSLAQAPVPSDPLPVDSVKEKQPGVHSGGLRCTCANSVRQALVPWWVFWPQVFAAAC